MSTQSLTMQDYKAVGDVGAAALTLATVMQWAPAIAAVFTALYAMFRLYEAVYNHFKQRKANKDWPYQE